MKQKVNIMWFRRDLRLQDNAALYYALKSGHPVLPIFIFDKNILDDLEEKKDRRVEFLHQVLHEMQEELAAEGSSLKVFYETPEKAFVALFSDYEIDTIFANEDFEQYAIERDKMIQKIAEKHSVKMVLYKDQVIFSNDEIVKDDKTPYTIFTPYSKKWKAALNKFYLKAYPCKKYSSAFLPQKPHRMPSLESMGFEKVGKPFPANHVSKSLLKDYKETRDYPGIKGTSHMGVHLRFGTVSIRKLVRLAMENSEVFLNELIWREFYQMILSQFEHVRKYHSFRKEYDHIRWRNNEKEFDAWCNGQTGYPIVDAGMRELNATGFMHNRVRMITASFLTKHLLIDWRWGESYFAKKLLDYDFASNNGGWQWAAGCGCDAAPYFRVFNPTLQTQKFDKNLQYIRKWVPELDELSYPKPIVEHEIARKKALEVYSKAVKK